MWGPIADMNIKVERIAFFQEVARDNEHKPLDMEAIRARINE